MPCRAPPWWQGPEQRRDRCPHASPGVAALLPLTGPQAPSSGAQPGQVRGGQRGAGRGGGAGGSPARRGGWPPGALLAEVPRATPPNPPDNLGSGSAGRLHPGTPQSERNERLRTGGLVGKGTWGWSPVSFHLGWRFQGEIWKRAAALALLQGQAAGGLGPIRVGSRGASRDPGVPRGPRAQRRSRAPRSPPSSPTRGGRR